MAQEQAMQEPKQQVVNANPADAQPEKKSKWWLWSIVAVVLVILLIWLVF